MIPTLLRIDWINLRRDRVALGLTFVLPVVFFSIFAAIFGGLGGGGGGGSGGGGFSGMKIVVVDEDDSRVSRAFVQALDDQEALQVRTVPFPDEENPDPAPYTREEGTRRVRLGDYPAAVIIPEGFGDSFADFGALAGGGERKAIDLVHDPSNPLARHVIAGLLQASAMMAAPDVLMESGLEQLETFGGALTPSQRQAVDEFLPVLRGEKSWEELADDEDDTDASASSSAASGLDGFTGLVEVNAISARAGDEDDGDGGSYSIVSYYAAGIGVMFLLFSMAGAAGTLLQEQETGTLERLLSSNLSMGTLLAGHWLFFAIVGFAQLTVMFVWGALVFSLDLFTAKHLAGFAAMSLVTSTAAAAFGIMLATICRSRGQLGGISTIVILIMSALGGSMVPRFIMPEFMNTTALFTFNGWALDGYLKVFWYDDPQAGVLGSLLALLPQLGVLAGLTIVFLAVARTLARRWETT